MVRRVPPVGAVAITVSWLAVPARRRPPRRARDSASGTGSVRRLLQHLSATGSGGCWRSPVGLYGRRHAGGALAPGSNRYRVVRARDEDLLRRSCAPGHTRLAEPGCRAIPAGRPARTSEVGAVARSGACPLVRRCGAHFWPFSWFSRLAPERAVPDRRRRPPPHRRPSPCAPEPTSSRCSTRRRVSSCDCCATRAIVHTGTVDSQGSLMWRQLTAGRYAVQTTDQRRTRAARCG